MIKKFAFIFGIILIWALLSLFLLSAPIQILNTELSNLIVNSTLSLSGIYLAVIGILLAVYWSGALIGQTKLEIRRLVGIITTISITSAITCLVAFIQFITNSDFLILPMIILFVTIIYFSIIVTVLLVSLLLGVGR